MLRKITLVFVTVAAVAGVSSAVIAAEETRPAKDFTAVTLFGSGELEITSGKEFSVVLSGDPELLSHIVTEVRKDTLHIGPERKMFGWTSNKGRLHARVTMPSLSAATVAGSGDIHAKGLDGGRVTFTVAGSGDVEAEGSVEKAVLAINSSGEGDFENLKAAETVVTINGSGDVVVQAEKSLVATINGSGSIDYIGAPEKLTKVIYGSGKIRQR